MSYTSLYPTLTFNDTLKTSLSYGSISFGSLNAGSKCPDSNFCSTGLCCAYLYNSNANCS